MLGLELYRRLPPRLTAFLFFYGLPALLVLRFFFGSLFGIFISSVALYWYTLIFGEVKPYSMQQLVLWLDSLPNDSKTSVVTTVITIAGFLVAFKTATANWKAENLATLKSHVASELEEFFANVSKLTTDAEIYVKRLVEAVNKIQSEGATADSAFAVHWAIERLPDFLHTRERLSFMTVEAHRISGRHTTILSTIDGATRAIEDCANALSEISRDMWVRLPNIPEGHNDPLGLFLLQINVEQCNNFLECCRANFGLINGLSGGVRGALLSPIVGINMSTITSLYGKRQQFEEAMAKVRLRRSDGG